MTPRPLKVRIDNRMGAWWATLDQLDGKRLRGYDCAVGEEEDGEIQWWIEAELPGDVDRKEVEEALHIECTRLSRYGYTSTTELDRHVREGRVRALGN